MYTINNQKDNGVMKFVSLLPYLKIFTGNEQGTSFEIY
jgi:hypothetical protein